MYIQKNISISQEFHFANPQCKIMINNIYNMHMTGFQLWNLFGEGAKRMIGTYNRSIKTMCNLPYDTHRYFMEHLSTKDHIWTSMLSRYLGFIKAIEISSKGPLRRLLNTCKNDVRSITGSNLREIMILVGKNSIGEVEKGDIDSFKYHEPPTEERWRLGLLDELLDLQHGDLVLPLLNEDEIEQIKNSICSD